MGSKFPSRKSVIPNSFINTSSSSEMEYVDHYFKYDVNNFQGRHHKNFFGGLCKSWTFYPGQYSDLRESSTKIE